MGGIINSVLKPIGKAIGYDSDAIAKAGNDQAAATASAAQQTSNANKEAARAAQSSQETMVARQKASDTAADLLNTPVAQADVTTGEQDTSAIDTTTGARKKPRDAYSSAGLNI